MMYKIIHNLISIPKSHYLIPCTSSTHHHSSTYKLPYSRVNNHLFSFFPPTIRLWNSLDNETVNQVTLQQFKKRLNHVSFYRSDTALHYIHALPCLRIHHIIVILCCAYTPLEVLHTNS